MANPNNYIVFEPDQVLTNDHLNEMFNYLDQQNRWTRNKLIGIGIVCGLDIVQHTGTIEITKGCGVTSQGYLIVQDTSQFAYYIPYSPIDQPNDLPFTYPGNLPFYKPFCQNKTIWLLLTDDQYNALETADQQKAQTLSSVSSTFLSDYAVVLFLEANEKDLKNCNMLDCNNEGEKILFQVKPLLVAKKDLPGIASVTGGEIAPPKTPEVPHQIKFKRFNVPYTNLKTTDDIIHAFLRLVDDVTLTNVANSYISSFEKYKAILNVNTNPFTALAIHLKNLRNEIIKVNPVFIEYFYDFIDDLIKAYYEFIAKISDVVSACCPDENLFPLHLVLGDASKNTTSFVHDPYRQYFIYSPLFGNGKGEVSEVVLLFHRMVLLVKEFTFPKAMREITIKITPSQYDLPWLSQRAIPFYYHINESGNELYKSWSYYKTSHGNAAFNLGYNANLYNTNDAVVHPLLYDIEHYNFFRVEGHIGRNYKTVLQNLLQQRIQFNLPVDVVAVSAELLTTGTNDLPVCNFQDLETDFRLLVSELACRIHIPLCYLAQVSLTGNENSFTPFAEYKVNTIKNAEEPPAFLQLAYKVGDFMNSRCNPPKGTLGSEYLTRINYPNSEIALKELFLSFSSRAESPNFLLVLFRFFDNVERLLMLLLTQEISQIDKAGFITGYDNYAQSLGALTGLMKADASNTTGFFTRFDMAGLATELNALMSFCFDERLLVLLAEYLRRLHLYNLQLSFLQYYRKHPGLEHKAGVPKGGTFVVVYHKTADRLTNFRLQEFTAESTVKTLNPSQIELIRNFVNDCDNSPTPTKQQILDLLPPFEVSGKFNFADGEVIADFYLPYLCCSDCPPVAYMIPAPAPVQEKPVITMATTFCSNDKKPAKIEVSIPGGTFNTVPGLDGDTSTFTPLVAGAGTFLITYTVNGVASDPVKVVVMPVPAKIDFKADPPVQSGNNFFMTFIPTVTDDSFNYQWTFDPKVFTKPDSTDKSPVMQLVNPPEKIKTVVILKITNKCGSDEIKHQLIITFKDVIIK
jgi:hypothetical protein